MSFNKSDLITQVATASSSSKTSAERVINAIFSSIKKALQEGNEARLVGFGTFVVKSLPARSGRNPRNGESLHLPASKKPVFRPGMELKKALNSD